MRSCAIKKILNRVYLIRISVFAFVQKYKISTPAKLLGFRVVCKRICNFCIWFRASRIPDFLNLEGIEVQPLFTNKDSNSRKMFVN